MPTPAVAATVFEPAFALPPTTPATAAVPGVDPDLPAGVVLTELLPAAVFPARLAPDALELGTALALDAGSVPQLKDQAALSARHRPDTTLSNLSVLSRSI
jgi:hypothetical protein